MRKVIAGFTMSLDGYINDPSGSVEKLFPDLASLRYARPLREAIQNTGAVVMGRKAFAMSEDPDWFAGNYEFQVPIFVLTHEPPRRHPKESGDLTFTFVTEGIESAIRQAKAAAGDKDVAIIGGGSTMEQSIQAGLIDELHIDILPVLLGGGMRPFEGHLAGEAKLERLEVVELPGGRTHLRYRFLKPGS